MSIDLLIEYVKILVLLSYVSLFIELTFFSVPSVASSFSLWQSKGEYREDLDTIGVNNHHWSFGKKILFLALPILIIFATFAIPLLWSMGYNISTHIFPKSTFVTLIIGSILLIIGRLITMMSVFTIRKQNSQKNNSFKLHKASLYNRSRNPIQVGLYIFGLGLFLINPSLLFLAGFTFYIYYMHYKILIEERFLTNKFGDSYSKYLLEKKRYL